MGQMIAIPIPKAGAGVTFDVDMDILGSNEFPLAVYLEICLQGCKTLLNRGQSKLKSSKGMEGAEKDAAVKAILAEVQKQYDAMLAGETRITGGKGKLKGVPVTLESGKKMPEQMASIEIEFKNSQHMGIAVDGDAYEHILEAAIDDRRELFVGSREIFAAWKFADTITKLFKKTKLEIY